jgi:glutaredoxin
LKVTVYSRPECHLCADAVEQVRSIAGERSGVEIEVVNIEADDLLLKRFLERIPVVTVGEEVVSELVFEPEELRSRLRIA